VADVRQVIDWAETRGELDAGRVAVLGISFGGFVSAIAMGVDSRIKAGIFIVTGGNANKISWLSRTGQYRKRYRRTVAEHNGVQEQFYRYLEEVAEKGFENVEADHISFLTDPLTFATCLKGRSILMINARYDKYIPVETVDELWQACGKPDIKWFPFGHITIWLRYSAIRKKIVDFLHSI
jgi:dipeptidyl aminopeptidase/acylaminoacyl peptidase